MRPGARTPARGRQLRDRLLERRAVRLRRPNGHVAGCRHDLGSDANLLGKRHDMADPGLGLLFVQGHSGRFGRQRGREAEDHGDQGEYRFHGGFQLWGIPAQYDRQREPASFVYTYALILSTGPLG